MANVFRRPTPGDPGYDRPLPVHCIKRTGCSFEMFEYERFLGPVCWNADAKLDRQRKQSIVRARELPRISIGVPSRNGQADRIVYTLWGRVSEIGLMPLPSAQCPILRHCTYHLVKNPYTTPLHRYSFID